MHIAVAYLKGDIVAGSLIVGTSGSFYVARNFLTGEVIEEFYPSRLTTFQKKYANFLEGLGSPVIFEGKQPFISADYLPSRDMWVIGYALYHGTKIVAGEISAQGTWRKRIRNISANQQTLQVWSRCHQEVLMRIDGVKEAIEIVRPFYKRSKA